MLKHVGKVGSKPCVVLYREVPNDPEFCLVVETQGLDYVQHDALMNVVQSPEAQESNEISEVLFRRQFPDGSNMLNSLHFNRKINKVAVSLVTLTPNPNVDVPLVDVLKELKKIKNGSNPPTKIEADPSALTESTVVETQLISTQTDQEVITEDQPVVGNDDMASQLLFHANLLEEDAKILLAQAEEKRQQAYTLNPELEPRKGPGRPPKKATL